MNIEKEICERKKEAQRMRRAVAGWLIDGISEREARREYDKIKEYEKRTKKLEELVAKESGYIFNKIGFV